MTHKPQSLFLFFLLSFFLEHAFANNTSSAYSIATFNGNTPLESIISAHYQDEVARIAKERQWPNYEIDVEVRIAPAAQHLPPCPVSLLIEGRDNHPLPIGRLKRVIHCDSKNVEWRIQAAVISKITLPIFISTRTLKRGEPITLNDIQQAERTISRPISFFTDSTELLTMQVHRQIRTGQIITREGLSNIPIIRRGDQVLMTATQGGFSASTVGIALEDGRKNQQIKVQNNSSNKIVHAIVIDRNQVKTVF